MNVDIVLPLHNGRRWAAEAIDSVREQTWPDWHLFVVDDDSADDFLPELRERYEPIDRRIRFSRTPVKSGPGLARMYGLSQGHSELIAFIDQDDCWLPDKLERQCRRMAAKPTVQAVFSQVRHIDEEGRPLQSHATRKARLRGKLDFDGLSQQQLKQLLFVRHDLIPLVSVLVRRESFEHIGGFDSRLQGGQDNDFWVRFAASGCRVARLDEEHVARRIHAGNTSRTAQWRRGQWESLEKIVSEHEDLRPCLSGRQRNLICEEAMNLLEAGQIGECRAEAMKMLRIAAWDYRAWALLILSVFPARGAAWIRAHLR